MTDKLSAKRKLQWLGFTDAAKQISIIQAEINILKQNNVGYDDFQNNVSNRSAFSSFKTYLKNNGFSQKQADLFVNKIKNNYDDEDSSGTTFDEFKDFVVNGADSYEGLKSGFGDKKELSGDSETTAGESAAGIKFHDSQGTTRDNTSVPTGTTEIYGKEIHFSSVGSGDGTSEVESNPVDERKVNYKNLTASKVTPTISDNVTLSVDVENTNTQSIEVMVPLNEDDDWIKSKTITIDASSTQSVSFDIIKQRQTKHVYTVKDTSGITVAWGPAELQ